MRYQLLLRADRGEQSGAEEHTAVPAVRPLAGGPAGVTGLQWLWELVELRLGQAEPDSAA
jgi:hypothetical protein